MQTISSNDMKTMETDFLNNTSFSSLLLMEIAATKVFEVCQSYVTKESFVAVLCGTGNNGGDGYAVARMLLQKGVHCAIYALAPPKTKDAQTMCHYVKTMYHAEIKPLHEFNPKAFTLVIDALYGTGFQGALPSEVAHLVRQLNETEKIVISVDIPSGLNPNGFAENVAVRATTTVTFHKIKESLILSVAPQYVGKIVCADIGIPPKFDTTTGITLVQKEEVLPYFKPLNPITHKTLRGKVLVFAGSKPYAGAALLVAQAAKTLGCGLLTLASSSYCIVLLQQTNPTCMGFQVETETEKHALLDRLNQFDAVVLGPGLSDDDFTKTITLELLNKIKALNLPCVVDAQALRFLAQSPMLLSENFILTPHVGEAADLLGTTVESIFENYKLSAQKLHQKFNATILLKSARSLVFDGTQFFSHTHGSPCLGKAGSGDSLCGIMVALLAQRQVTLSLSQCAAFANFIFALSSEYASQEKGEYSADAKDAVSAIVRCLQA